MFKSKRETTWVRLLFLFFYSFGKKNVTVLVYALFFFSGGLWLVKNCLFWQSNVHSGRHASLWFFEAFSFLVFFFQKRVEWGSPVDATIGILYPLWHVFDWIITTKPKSFRLSSQLHENTMNLGCREFNPKTFNPLTHFRTSRPIELPLLHFFQIFSLFIYDEWVFFSSVSLAIKFFFIFGPCLHIWFIFSSQMMVHFSQLSQDKRIGSKSPCKFVACYPVLIYTSKNWLKV